VARFCSESLGHFYFTYSPWTPSIAVSSLWQVFETFFFFPIAISSLIISFSYKHGPPPPRSPKDTKPICPSLLVPLPSFVIGAASHFSSGALSQCFCNQLVPGIVFKVCRVCSGSAQPFLTYRQVSLEMRTKFFLSFASWAVMGSPPRSDPRRHYLCPEFFKLHASFFLKG